MRATLKTCWRSTTSKEAPSQFRHARQLGLQNQVQLIKLSTNLFKSNKAIDVRSNSARSQRGFELWSFNCEIWAHCCTVFSILCKCVGCLFCTATESAIMVDWLIDWLTITAVKLFPCVLSTICIQRAGARALIHQGHTCSKLPHSSKMAYLRHTFCESRLGCWQPVLMNSKL